MEIQNGASDPHEKVLSAEPTVNGYHTSSIELGLKSN